MYYLLKLRPPLVRFHLYHFKMSGRKLECSGQSQVIMENLLHHIRLKSSREEEVRTRMLFHSAQMLYRREDVKSKCLCFTLRLLV